MEGTLIIDGRDAYTEFSVVVTNLTPLLAMPPLKEVVTTVWPGIDGDDPDLTEPKLDALKAELALATLSPEGYERFISFLSTSLTHTWEFPQIGRTFALRTTAYTSLSAIRGIRTFSISLSWDKADLEAYDYFKPSPSIPQQAELLIDGLPFTSYNCKALQGYTAQILRAADPQEPLSISSDTFHGLISDNPRAWGKTREAQIPIYLKADTTQSLWAYYGALLHDLVKPGQRIVDCPELSLSLCCRYKSSTADYFHHDSHSAVLKLTITLVVSSVTALQSSGRYLATEDGDFIITEDGKLIPVTDADYSYRRLLLAADDLTLLTTEQLQPIAI